MDTPRPESGNVERNYNLTKGGEPVRPPEREGHQPRNPVLGGRGDDEDNHPRHHDDKHLYHIIHFHINKHDRTGHHHHGPGDNDILIHDDKLCAGDHNIHIVHDYNGAFEYDIEYGPADHNHDAPVIDNNLVQHHDPYGHDDDNLPL